MIPRDYQVRAYDAVLDSLRRGHNPIAAIATGGGKSLLLSMLVDKFRSNGGYSLVLANSKELIVQNMRSMRLYRGLDGIGVYSAGLNHNTIGTAATYGTIQTIYRNLHRLPEVDVVLVDPLRDPLLARMSVGIAAGDDVLRDLDGQLLRALLVEVDDRRDIAGDVGDEQVTNTARGLHG